jgi:tRNA pseudouridine-54 N-methylase
MSTKDDALFAEMDAAYRRNNPYFLSSDHNDALQDVLTVAREAILKEAAKAVFSISLDSIPLFAQHHVSMRDMEIAARIRSLSNQEQPQ